MPKYCNFLCVNNEKKIIFFIFDASNEKIVLRKSLRKYYSKDLFKLVTKFTFFSFCSNGVYGNSDDEIDPEDPYDDREEEIYLFGDVFFIFDENMRKKFLTISYDDSSEDCMLNHIENPTYEEKLIAVKHDCNSFFVIQKRTREMIDIIFYGDVGACFIEQIDNPSMETQMKAVLEDHRNLKLLENPFQEVIEVAKILKRDSCPDSDDSSQYSENSDD